MYIYNMFVKVPQKDHVTCSLLKCSVPRSCSRSLAVTLAHRLSGQLTH